MSIDVEALKARTNIVEVVSRYVPSLKQIGRDWKACCPFHQESTASFTVHPAPDSYYKCFGCSAGGDVISFVENIERTDFQGALKILSNGHEDLYTASNGNGAGKTTPPPEWIPKEKAPDLNLPAPADAPDCSFIHSGLSKPNEVWAYRSPKGELLGYDARYNKPDGTKDKVLPWRWFDGEWRMKGFAAPSPLYGLEALGPNLKIPVLMVEGAKCVHSGRRIFKTEGYVVSWQGGANAVAKVDLSPLHGRPILFMPDADSEAKKTPGQKAMLYLANKLVHVCPQVLYFDPNPKVKCVVCDDGVDELGQPCAVCKGSGKVFQFDLMPDGWDIADAEAAGWDAQMWREWAKPRLKDIKIHVVEESIAKAKEEKKKAVKKIAEGTPQRPPMPHQALWVQWGMQLQGGSGIPHASLDNVCRVLENDPNFKNFVYYDTFLGKTFNCHTNREWADEDEVNLMLYMQRTMGLQKVSRTTVAEAIIATAYKDTRNCVKEWLETLKWDGVERLEDFFPDFFGTAKNVYTMAVGRCFLVSLVARAYLPGCKADHMIVLEGPQGIRKSSALEALVGSAWYADTSESVASKDFFQLIQGKWLIELGEMGALDKSDRETVKQMLSRRSDRFRGSYARYAVDRPRQGVFAGTTNKDNWNRDDTGARRFWPIRCREIDLKGILAIREQLFAEAVARFKRVELTATEGERVAAGADWWVTPFEETRIEQDARYEGDPWTEPIIYALTGQLEMTIGELLTETLKVEIGRQGAGEQRRVSAILRHHGWSKHTGMDSGTKQTQRIWRPRESEYDL